MEMLKIYRLANYELLRQLEKEEEINKNTLAQLGRENSISLDRIEKINKDLAFLKIKILELEQNEKHEESIFSHLDIRDPQEAFENAIKNRLKEPGDYMYMYTDGGKDYFKHIVTRQYREFKIK